MHLFSVTWSPTIRQPFTQGDPGLPSWAQGHSPTSGLQTLLIAKESWSPDGPKIRNNIKQGTKIIHKHHVHQCTQKKSSNHLYACIMYLSSSFSTVIRLFTHIHTYVCVSVWVCELCVHILLYCRLAILPRWYVDRLALLIGSCDRPSAAPTSNTSHGWLDQPQLREMGGY